MPDRPPAGAPLVVVAAAIVDGDPPRLLAARRRGPGRLAGYWELPGGKVEPGEDERTALRRECAEELGVDISVGERIGPDHVINVDGRPARLRVWGGTVVSGKFQHRAHDELRWLEAGRLGEVSWLPADRDLVDDLRRWLVGSGAVALTDRRLLLVHAHPDDETIGTGATMARYAAAGAHVCLVTCTRGELGEIVVPDLAELAADKQDRLGEHRVGELTAACTALGVTDHRFLGGAGRFRDSGMMGEPSNDDERAFWRADPEAAVRELVPVLREVRPQVVVSYDADGGYGHPDHIRAHDVTIAAFDAAADPAHDPDAGAPWTATKLYASVVPRSALAAGIELLRAQGKTLFGVERVEDLPFGVPDEQVTTAIDARDRFDAKLAALRAHRSQVSVDGPFFALSNNVGQRAFGREFYRLLRGPRGPAGAVPDEFDRTGTWEDDLFAGLDV